MSESTTAFKQGPWTLEVQPDLSGFRTGTIDIPTEVELHIALFEEIGALRDKGKVRDLFTRDLEALSATGLAMRIVPEVPAEHMAWSSLVTFMDSIRPDGVDTAYFYPNLWNPGTEVNSLTHDELASRATRVRLRGLLLNANTETGMDPVLHHLGLPADDCANERWEHSKYPTTQAIETAKNIQDFEASFPNITLRGANHHDFAWDVTKHRLDLSGSGEQLLSQGWMRVLDLNRHQVGGGSGVPGVDSSGSRARFAWGSGRADSGGGVGFSAGPK